MSMSILYRFRRLHSRLLLAYLLHLTLYCVVYSQEPKQQECTVNDDGNTAGSCWHEELLSNPIEFFRSRVFGVETQDPFQDLEEGYLHNEKPNLFATLQKLFDSQPDDNTWEEVLVKNLKTAQQTLPDQSFTLTLNRLKTTFSEMSQQLTRTFSDVRLERFNLVQTYYAMLHEEATKNAVWKRRQHRYLPSLSEKQAIALSDGLYLSQLAYVSSCAEVEQGLQDFYNDSWVMVNCTTVGQPLQPAHFVAVKRQQAPAKFSLFGNKSRVLEIAVVIRGSKEIADFISDGHLKEAEYRGGLAHDGIRQSALWLHALYRDFFLKLQKASKSSKVKVWLVGHSLGAGTAALASLEFNAQEDVIEAHSMGFGTPAVLSRNLSESLLNTVTTVIHDADVVPRMSGTTLANAWIKIVQYNWTDDALEDIHQLLPVLKDNVVPPAIAELYCTEERKDQIVDWLRTYLTSQNQPINDLPLPSEPKLMPPGDCIHLYRDGLQWQGSYMPCYRFNEIEIVRSFVDDHLVVPGYYAGLLGFVRALKKDFNWRFEHDPSRLPV